jgi:hypothetical protein
MVPTGLATPLTGDVGGAAVDRLEEADVAAEARGREHAERAGDDRREVGEDVAEQVRGHDHVEARGLAHDLHGGVVDVEVVERDVGVLGRCTPTTTSRQNCETSRTLALSTLVTRPPRCLAASKATRAMRSTSKRS